MRTLPNWLSAFRLVMVPVLGAIAWHGASTLFLVLLAVSLASDVLDGFLARRLGCASAHGARLDSWGDLATYASLPLFAWWLWPELLRAQSVWLGVALLAFAAPTLVGWLRFRRLTSYHTWGAKLTSMLMGIGALVLFMGGPTWLFHVATMALVLEALEELMITALLPEWRADVPTLWHARQLRESGPLSARSRPLRVTDSRGPQPRQLRDRSRARSSRSIFAFTVRRSSPSRRAASS
jgi:phosphatidylglycerophosphate synthase